MATRSRNCEADSAVKMSLSAVFGGAGWMTLKISSIALAADRVPMMSCALLTSRCQRSCLTSRDPLELRLQVAQGADDLLALRLVFPRLLHRQEREPLAHPVQQVDLALEVGDVVALARLARAGSASDRNP